MALHLTLKQRLGATRQLPIDEENPTLWDMTWLPVKNKQEGVNILSWNQPTQVQGKENQFLCAWLA